jgi:hypothetical protein
MVAPTPKSDPLHAIAEYVLLYGYVFVPPAEQAFIH